MHLFNSFVTSERRTCVKPLWTVFNTLIPLSRELWPMIDSVISSLFTHHCTRGVSDTLYRSRVTLALGVRQWNKHKIISARFTEIFGNNLRLLIAVTWRSLRGLLYGNNQRGYI